MNPMRNIRIEKLTLNVGTGKEQQKLEKGIALIKHIVGIEPVKTITSKRIAGWGLRPGLPIGCKLTLRGKKADKVLRPLLGAKDHILNQSCFDDNGNISFGIDEYIDIPDIEYNADIGIMGFQVTVTLERPGFRIKRRKLFKKQLPSSHKIKQEEAIQFMKESYEIKLGEE
ncbi:MAG: 50S ribosomal protein L5 [Candidatus Woesearchaeota archaeon]